MDLLVYRTTTNRTILSGWTGRGICLRAKVAGIGIHAFRRLAITRAQVHAGLDYAQAVAGHKSRQATEIYIVPAEVEVLPLE